MALRNPTQGPRIVPFGHNRTASDKLPNGRPAFRVTQRYWDVDRYFGGYHSAIDLGNYYCGDMVLSSTTGTVLNRKDIYGALIVEVLETNGNITGYGHLSRFAKPHGSWVTAGALLGYVGSTGLGGVCHVHYYRRVGGRLVDPWPLLDQNQVTTTRVTYSGTCYSIGSPWIRVGTNGRNGVGGNIVGRASLGQRFSAKQVEKAGPRYQDWRNGAWRTDWVVLTDNRSIAKAFIKKV